MARMDTVTTSSATGGNLTPAAAAHMIAARLTDIEAVARDTNLYTFRRADGAPLLAYKPGAHVDLHLPNGLVRQFSLVVPDANPESYVVGVKRDENSRGGSRYIIDEMKVGDEQRILRRPEERAIRAGEEIVTGERSGNQQGYRFVVGDAGHVRDA